MLYNRIYEILNRIVYQIKEPMFLLMSCATITDKVQFPASGQIAGIAPEMNKARQRLREYSDVKELIKKTQEGQVIMSQKPYFDNYLKAQVQIMRACVTDIKKCPFSYISYMDEKKTITTTGLSIKEQWAIQMIMSRYNTNSIYHMGAYSNLQFIFKETINSYDKGYKNTSKFITNLQATYKYFNEGYQPLKRLKQVYQTLQLLFSKNNKSLINQIVQIKKQVFQSIVMLVACNLAYLKLEKYRFISQYRSCKELAYSIYNLIKDIRKILVSFGVYDKIHSQMKNYMDLGEIFFLAYSFYFLLEQHEELKNNQEYGFIKKQFQQMIVQNCVVCDQFIKLANKMNNFPGKQTFDNVIFVNELLQKMLKQVNKKKYAYAINIHENKNLAIPSIEQVIIKRIGLKNIWESISQF